MNYFITSTDTNAGKTYATALLTRSLRKAGWNTVAMKPLSCGGLDDSETLRAAADNELSLEEVTPVSYKAALGPLDAAPLEGKQFSCEEIIPTFQHLRKKYSSLLVEGIGGWLVPLSPKESLPDLVQAMGLPVLLVVRNRLGALNHTLLTLESIQHHGMTCDGILLNHHPEDQDDLAIEGNRRFLQKLAIKLQLPFFLEIYPKQVTIDVSQFIQTKPSPLFQSSRSED
ncbi:MAG: dethiobiotin synthase [Verrucomicrobia bacterium RIFCSPHIGHO2_12_FULL_41_10]|nr:MAG: dethiobiotin synthase [Verrucomicrobia bacterium RIFCSPHIGHO2_12_FULL_41_10]HLB33103.1 dethiobiotin synthase [Chthoniobacterales bacterium]